ELLGHNDDPATRDLLRKLLAETDDWSVFHAALASARRLWGAESPEPDYAAVQNTEAVMPDERDELFRRLQERGDARRLMEILPKLDADGAERLKVILLNRQPLPVAEAQAGVAGPDAVAAGGAARLLGRAGPEAGGGGWDEGDKNRQEEIRRGAGPGQRTGGLAAPLRSLVWAAGRLGGATDTLLAVATTRADVPFDRPLRREAVTALAAGELTKAVAPAPGDLAA